MIASIIYHAKMLRAMAVEKARIELDDARDWAYLVKSVIATGGPREYLDGLDAQVEHLRDEKMAAIDELGQLTATLGDTVAPLVLLLWPDAAAPVVNADRTVTRETFQPLSGGRTLRAVVQAACRALAALPGSGALADPPDLAEVKRQRDAYKEHADHAMERLTAALSRVEELQAEVSKLKTQAEHTPELVRQRRKRDEERITRALSIACPECAAEPKEPCMSKITTTDGKEKFTRRAPHPKRFEAAFPPKKRADSEDSEDLPSVDGKGEQPDNKGEQ